MKKILIFSTAYYPYVGGAEVAVREITDRIADFEFDMITAKMSGKNFKKEKIGNINVHRIGLGIPFFDKYLLAFWGRKMCKKNKYDAIWAIMASYGGFSAMFFKKKNPNIPFLLTLQEGDDIKYINKRVRFVKKWFREIFLSADYIQAISNYLADWARKQGVKCPISVVPNGVDIKRFSSPISQELNKNYRERIKFNDGDKILITTSRLVKKNAIEDVIKSLQYLPKNIVFLILGEGPDLKKLKNLSKDLKVDDRVRFLGHIDHKEMPNYLKISDIFIRPSLSEGLGNSFLEAMLSGIPVVATRVGGIPDFLKDGETGLFCGVRNPKDIAEKVKIYLTNEDLRNRIIKNSQDMIKRVYNWDKIAEKMKDIFQNMKVERKI